jgi:cytochrome c oxidase cbb3-type subunit III
MKKRDEVLGHADEADGIEEYDNPLPGWWLGLLYATIGFAAVYTLDYHFVRPTSQIAEWQAEMDEAESRWPSRPAAVATTTTPEAVDAGKTVFQTNCVGCHGADLHGGVGPDLTDPTWIHGGTLPEITATINNGVPEKGMLTWGPILGPEKVAQVAAYVHASGGGI